MDRQHGWPNLQRPACPPAYVPKSQTAHTPSACLRAVPMHKPPLRRLIPRHAMHCPTATDEFEG